MAETFPITWKGYDPTHVDQAMAALHSTIRRLENQLANTVESQKAAVTDAADLKLKLREVTERSDRLQSDLDAATEKLTDSVPLKDASFDHFGDRIKQILNIAQEEADEIVQTAQEKAEQVKTAASEKAQQVTEDAHREADDLRVKAEADAAKTVEDANARADQIRTQVDEEAASARKEAADLLEAQRAKATAATLDFERTLAERREQALESLDAEVAARHRELNDATLDLNEARSEAQKVEHEARERAESIVRAAEQRAADMIAEAQTRADIMRQNAEREMNAAIARRDSINDQLSNVREMLSAYGSVAAVELVEALENEDGSQPDADETFSEEEELTEVIVENEVTEVTDTDSDQ